MSGQKPVMRLVVVLKTDKTRKLPIASAWESERGGYSTKWEEEYGDRPGIQSITLTNGKTIEVEDLFLNIYDERMRRPDGGGGSRGNSRGGREGAPPSTGGGNSQDSGGDDDIPF